MYWVCTETWIQTFVLNTYQNIQGKPLIMFLTPLSVTQQGPRGYESAIYLNNLGCYITFWSRFQMVTRTRPSPRPESGEDHSLPESDSGASEPRQAPPWRTAAAAAAGPGVHRLRVWRPANSISLRSEFEVNHDSVSLSLPWQPDLESLRVGRVRLRPSHDGSSGRVRTTGPMRSDISKSNPNYSQLFLQYLIIPIILNYSFNYSSSISA